MRARWSAARSVARSVTVVGTVLAVGFAIVVTPLGIRSAGAAVALGKPSVPGRSLAVKPARPDPEDVPAKPLPKPVWPRPGSATVALPEAGKGATPVAKKAGGLPVRLAPVAGTASALAADVRTDVLPSATARRLGADGLAVRLSRTAGSAKSVAATLDYSGFRHAYGANFSHRLRVVALPGCVADARPCAASPKPLKADNDEARGRITANVPLDAADSGNDGSTVVLLEAAASGDTGTYKATDLKPSGKWEVGLQSGAFTYNYPIDLPAPPYGKAPDLALSYDSQDVDGRTSATNNQASWVGLGWDLQPGYIERKYKPCADDADGSAQAILKTWGDLCWDSPIKGKDDGAVYTISLNGQTSELIWDGDHYRMKDDQDWKIQHVTSGGQGAGGGEYWVITTGDGTQYRLGYGADPTKSANNATNSVWTVPVIGDDAGEPCHASDDPTKMASCSMPYRWNLDVVVDPNANETVYSYATETNAYRRVQSGNTLSYIRGGYLKSIEYGKNAGDPIDTPAPAKVDFTSYNRCVERTQTDDPYNNPPAACPTLAAGGATSYPDVPVDLICSSNCTEPSPSFFVTDRLDHITTSVSKTDGSDGYDKVATYQLKMAFPATGDTTDPSLWLDYVRRIGHMGDGDDVQLPTTDFNGTNFNNHASGTSMNYRRITTVQGDLGGDTNVTYGQPDGCDTGRTDWSGAANHDDCFQQYYVPDGATDGQWGIFNKYLVTKTTDVDRVGGSPDQVTTYDYAGGGGWRWDDDLSQSTEHQSWSDWRGYETVTATKGSGSTKTVTTSSFFRGLNDDRTNRDGTQTRTSTATDFDGNTYQDEHYLAGREYQQRQWREAPGGAAGGVDETSTRHTYWHYPTADGPGWHNASMVREADTVTRSRKADGTYRTTKSTTSYDDHGYATSVLDAGDTSVSSDDQCTTTSYARNTDDGHWMLSYAEIVLKHQDTCDGPLFGRTVTLYDGATTTAANGGDNKPVRGNVTDNREYRDADSYVSTRHTYDTYGRPTSETAANGTAATDDDTTTTSYAPATGWPYQGITTTTPPPTPGADPQTTTTISSRRDGAPVQTTDPNGHVTNLDYDRAGRLIRVWGPTEPKPDDGGDGVPTVQFTYETPFSGISAPSGPSYVKTEELQSGTADDPHWQTTWAYVDGFGRDTETQTASPSGDETGRMVDITRYDDRGLTAGETGVPVYNASAPGSGMLNPATAEIPSWTSHDYDTSERETASTLWSNGTKKWTTTTQPAADRTLVTDPNSHQTATWTDAQGRTTAIANDYDPSGSGTTKYHYTLAGDLDQITDASGNITQAAYNWAGERLSLDDPDAGHSQYAYDRAGNLTTTIDAKKQRVTTEYDALNRKTTQWGGYAGTGVKLADWTYDPDGAKGQLAASTRYVNGNAYRSEVTAYDDRYRPLTKRITIPDAEGSLAGEYDTSYTYDKADHLTSITYPEAGGLPEETVTATYDDKTGVARDLTSDLDGGYTYVKNTSYWPTGELGERDYGKNGGIARTYTYDAPTGDLASIKAVTGNDTQTPTPLQDDSYSWDPVGNLSEITDNLTTAQGGTGQRQCNTYDGMNRLQRAWTTTSAPCTDGINGADGSGPDPYKLAYHYTRAGNITSIDDGSAAIATTRTYTYPDTDTDPTLPTHPHAVTDIATSAGATLTDDRYSYNADGQLEQSTVTGKTTTYTWNELNQLTSATTLTGTTGFIYDADGTRLIRHDPDGSATLYLDGQEIRGPPAGLPPTATRYYSADDTTVALRHTGDTAATWLLSDQQASAQITIQGATGLVSRQRYQPFGAHRGGDALAGTEHDYLGKTEDPSTGLLALDNRYYDPSTGRFISPDPLADPSDTQSLNPYSYAANNPTSGSDPNGLMYSPDTGYPCDPDDSSCTGGPVGVYGPSGVSDPDRICRENLSCYSSNHVTGGGIYGRSSIDPTTYGGTPLSDPTYAQNARRLIAAAKFVTGYDDVEDCFTDGGWACGFAALDVLPYAGKLAKGARLGAKALKYAAKAGRAADEARDVGRVASGAKKAARSAERVSSKEHATRTRKETVLGLRYAGTRELAAARGASHLLDVKGYGNIKSSFEKAAHEDRISVNLNNMTGTGAHGKVNYAADSYAANPIFREGNITNYEMWYLRENNILPRVTFFHNGVVEDNPF